MQPHTLAAMSRFAMNAALVILFLEIVASEWCLPNKDSCHGNLYSFTKRIPFFDPELYLCDASYYQPHCVRHIRWADLDNNGELEALALLKDQFWLYERQADGNLSEGRQLEVRAMEPSLDGRSMTLFDWDEDGDLDAIISDRVVSGRCNGEKLEWGRRFRFFEHVKNSTGSLSFVEIQVPRVLSFLASECWNNTDVAVQVVSSQGGMKDLLLYATFSPLRYFRNQTGHFQEVLPEEHPFYGLGEAICSPGRLDEPEVVDWDGDGDLDIIALCQYTPRCGGAGCEYFVSYIEQLADGTLLKIPDGWTNTLDAFGPFGCGTCSLQVVDWNKDGQLGLFVNDNIMERTRATKLVQRSGDALPLSGLHFWNGKPLLVDWDQDGQLDLLVAEPEGLRLFRQEQGEFSEQDVDFDMVPLVSNGVETSIDAVDWNGDGDTDLVVVTNDGLIRVFDNHHGKLKELDASEHFLGASVPVNLTGILQLQLVDWDLDGDLDLVLGPWPGEDYDDVGGAFFEQVDGKLVQRENHSLAHFRSPALTSSDLSWKILDCDGDGDLDLLRFFEHRFRGPSHLSNFVVCCKQQNSQLLCPEFDVFVPHDFKLQTGDQFHLTAGDLDNDGDLDIVAMKWDSWSKIPSEPFLHDTGFCTARQRCSGRGFCMASGQCSCSKDRKLNDCSGCAVGHYTASYVAGSSTIHGCTKCPVGAKDVVCAGRGVCMDDAFAQHKMRTTSRLARGNGSCICIARQFSGPNCAEGLCPAGFAETLVTATPLQHPDVPKCFGCQVCPAGAFSNAGEDCQLCRPGHFATLGSQTCSPCPAGTFSAAVGAGECQACPSGKHAAEGSLTCRSCDRGQIPSSQGASCQVCREQSEFLLYTADETSLKCVIPVLQWVTLAVFLLAVFFLTFFLVAACAYTIPIADIARQTTDGRVVVTSHGEHWLRFGMTIPVTFQGTGIPWLDASTWTVESLGKERLLLHTDSKENRPMETSIGWFGLGVWAALRRAGYLKMPLALWILGLGVVAVATANSGYLMPLMLCTALPTVLCALLVQAYYAFKLCKHTPISDSRAQFLKQLRQSVPKPVVTERGAARGVTLQKLQFFQNFFQGFIRDRSMYFVASNLIVPLTQEDGVSYAELIGPACLHWFVSHYWGMTVRHFMEALRRHASHFGGDENARQNMAYWVCTFSNSQHNIKEELGNGQICNSSFFLAMRDRRCHGTIMVLDEDALPLQRAWCLFEVFQTFSLCRERRMEDQEAPEVLYQGFVMSTSSGVLSAGQGGTDVCMAVASRLSQLDLRHAEATDARDLKMIHDLVEGAPGGFDSINALVRVSIRDALKTVYNRFQGDFQRLLETLNASVPSSVADEVVQAEIAAPTVRLSEMTISSTSESKLWEYSFPQRISTSIFLRFGW